MVKIHPAYLDTRQVFFSCSTCHSHLITQDNIISRAFLGRHGPAYLVENVVNMMKGEEEERMLMTGLHTVADISCKICQSKIGWIYLKSPEINQKYKEGKYIVEKAKVIKEVYNQVW